jgi:hypothetical protein
MDVVRVLRHRKLHVSLCLCLGLCLGLCLFSLILARRHPYLQAIPGQCAVCVFVGEDVCAV